MHFLPPLMASAFLFPRVHAWGAMGHEAIAYIAQNFVTTATAKYCQTILGDTSTSYLANVATWADTYRYTSAGSFSRPYHFIDAEDNPPDACSVSYSRDCGSAGCVVSAIHNYTTQLQNSEDLTALKFIVHFIGDIHQPLHDEAIDVGGNTISVTFAGATTNLHHIWDTEMPEKRAGGSTLAVAKTYATKLTTAINTGTYASSKASWLTGMTLSDPQSSALVWASGANAHVCDTVLKKGISYVEDNDLSGAYYTTALPVFEEQIARAGYRLAAWLNLIVTGSTGLATNDTVSTAPLIKKWNFGM